MEGQAPPQTPAPVKRLPKTTFNTVEYPGTIRENTSLRQAVDTLGRQKAVDDCFNRATKVLELRYDPADTWAHPIIGESVPVQRLLLKVVRRKRKIKNAVDGQQTLESSSAAGEELSGPSQGIFKAEVMGIVKSTVRFRAMADYRYTPDTTARIPQLIEALRSANPEALLDFEFKDTEGPRFVPIKSHALDPTITGAETREENSPSTLPNTRPETGIEFRSTMPTIPPPMFSRQVAPHTFLYQTNPSTRPVSYTHPITGEEYQRLINTNRAKTYAVRPIRYDEENVPDSPVGEIELAMKKLDPVLLKKLQAMLEQRPMWTRAALLNQFSKDEIKLLDSKKAYIPACCYTFQDCYLREILIRFNYDPRKDPNSYIYQKVHFRITSRGRQGARVRFKRHIDTDLAAELQNEGSFTRNSPNSHIFDGKTFHKSEATYQLIDITDRQLYDLIRDPVARRTSPDAMSGWYKQEALNVIKAIIRRKWVALSENRICTDNDCMDLVEEFYSRKQLTRASEEVSHGGRPKGGGGYVGGDIPTNTTAQSTSKKDKWKRKAIARLPAAAEDLTAARLHETLEREQRLAMQARHRNDDGSFS